MLSFSFWQRYFGEEASILGDEITVDGVPHTVIGVMPEDFDFIPANETCIGRRIGRIRETTETAGRCW